MDDTAIDSRCLKVVLEACSGVCRSFKQLHQRSTTMYYSPLFTMSLFLAGKLSHTIDYRDTLTNNLIMRRFDFDLLYLEVP